MKKLPKFLEKYFWDVEFEKFDAEAYPWDVLARLLKSIFGEILLTFILSAKGGLDRGKI